MSSLRDDIDMLFLSTHHINSKSLPSLFMFLSVLNGYFLPNPDIHPVLKLLYNVLKTLFVIIPPILMS